MPKWRQQQRARILLNRVWLPSKTLGQIVRIYEADAFMGAVLVIVLYWFLMMDTKLTLKLSVARAASHCGLKCYGAKQDDDRLAMHIVVCLCLS